MGNQQPDHSRISEFRRRNLAALAGLFVQVLRLCQKAGMVSLGHVALDGTKVQANASKHKAMSHERMLKAEKQLEKEINALMRKAEILDAQEDRRYGKSNRGSDLPDELRRRQDRLARIRQARKEIEAETAAAAARQRHEEAEEARTKATAAREADASAAEQAELNKKAEAAGAKAKAAQEKAIKAAEDAGVEPPDLEPLAADAMPRRGLARKADGSPTKKTQRNFTDPDSHLMQAGGTYLQGYNCQLAVDSVHQVIVSVGVSNQPPDVEHLEPMLQRIAANTGALPTVMTLDAGYWSEDNGKVCTESGHRRLHRHRPTPAWSTSTAETRTAPQRCRCQDPHGPQAEKQEGISDLRPTQGHRGAGERPDQGMPRPAALPLAGPGEGER